MTDNHDFAAAAADLASARIGRTMPHAEVLRARLLVQPGCVAVSGSPVEGIRACTSVYALNAAATERILQGGRGGGGAITLAGAPSARSLYVGVVVGAIGREVEALVLLHRHLATQLRSCPHVRLLLARAATPAGRRLLNRFELAPIAEVSDIVGREIDARFRTALLEREFRGAIARLRAVDGDDPSSVEGRW